MDIGNAASSRADFYDRNADVNILRFATNLVPHGLTIRDIYTVPVGRKAIVGSMASFCIRQGMAGTTGSVLMYYKYTPNGGAPVIVKYDLFVSSIVNDRLFTVITPTFAMYPGDVLTISTADGSVGGNITYDLTSVITEFDY